MPEQVVITITASGDARGAEISRQRAALESFLGQCHQVVGDTGLTVHVQRNDTREKK